MTGSTSRSGDDPTRTEPGGTNTTTKITEESSLGSDRAGDDGAGAHSPADKKPPSDVAGR